MVKIKLFTLLACSSLFSCDDVKNETTMLDTFRNTLLRSGLRCELKPDTGPCRAAIPKYYFDQKSKECKEFIWGGCNGTVPFNTLNECKDACQ